MLPNIAVSKRPPLHLVLAAIMCITFFLFSGAFMNIYHRFFWGVMLSYGLGVFYLFWSQQRASVYAVTMYLLLPPTLIFLLAVVRGTDAQFLPLALIGVWTLLCLIITSFFKQKIAGLLVAVVLTLLLSFVAYPDYVMMLKGTQVNIPDRRTSLPVVTNTDTTDIDHIPAKVVVLDMWNVGCGVCFKRFPELQRLYDHYRNNKEVYIASANIPYKSERRRAEALAVLDNYGFNKLNTLLYENGGWQIAQFPLVLVYDKNKVLRYTGQLNLNPVVTVNNTYDIIDGLLKEQ